MLINRHVKIIMQDRIKQIIKELINITFLIKILFFLNSKIFVTISLCLIHLLINSLVNFLINSFINRLIKINFNHKIFKLINIKSHSFNFVFKIISKKINFRRVIFNLL